MHYHREGTEEGEDKDEQAEDDVTEAAFAEERAELVLYGAHDALDERELHTNQHEEQLLLYMPTGSGLQAYGRYRPEPPHQSSLVHVHTSVPKPSVHIMMKKRMLQSCETGIRLSASGYTWNVSPGPAPRNGA